MIETVARQHALRVAARALEQRLNADRSDHVGPTLPCACGNDARYVGHRSKTFTTVLGEMALERAYYHCEICAAGFYPRDRALGLQDTSLSVATTRMVGLAAAMVSFAESSELMHELAGVPVDPKQVVRGSSYQIHSFVLRPHQGFCTGTPLYSNRDQDRGVPAQLR